MSESTCSVAGCERQRRGRGLCSGHYQRLVKHGDVDASRPLIQKQHRFDCPVPLESWDLGARGRLTATVIAASLAARNTALSWSPS